MMGFGLRDGQGFGGFRWFDPGASVYACFLANMAVCSSCGCCGIQSVTILMSNDMSANLFEHSERFYC